MTVRVYPYDEQEEKALIDFLQIRHYNYNATDEQDMTDAAFLTQYNNDLDEAEAKIDSGDYLTHDEVKKFLAEKLNIKYL